MKKISTFGFIAAAMILLVSCTESKMKKFAEEFATAVNNKDQATISKLYPDSKVAEALKIDFVKDSLSVEEVADTFIVSYGKGCSISIVKDKEGEPFVADSHGLFVYPAERMNFALKTGWVKPEMSDLKIAEQFTDTIFVNYLSRKNLEQIKSKLIVKSVKDRYSEEYFYDSHYNMIMPAVYTTATIQNNSDYDISGSDYEVYVAYCEPHNKKFPGKDIKKGETQTFTIKSCAQEMTGQASLKFVATDAELLAKYFTPKGGEYEDYQNSPIGKR